MSDDALTRQDPTRDAARDGESVDEADLPGFDTAEESAEGSRTGGTFSRRLSFAFATVAAITALLAAVLISAVWNYQFDQYLRGNLQRIADQMAHVAEQAYPRYGGWTLQTLSVIPRFGSIQGVAIQIVDDTGTIIYDDATMGAAAQNAAATGQDAMAEGVVLRPKGPVASSPVDVNGEQVGAVRVWAYGSGAVLTDRDAQFKRGSFAALTIAAFVAICLASIAGFWYAKRLVRPITRITQTAQALRSGDRDARTGLEGDDEIAELGRTFDEMADAIEADRELERRLTADVAHELRTPLQAIQATVEAMQDGVLPADEERLGTVRDETVRLARLADAILELTRLERGSLPFDLRRIDLAAPVRSAVDTHAALIDSRDIVLHTDITDNVRVIGDGDRLQQAVGNLLSNAARYTKAGGRIEVRLARESGCALIEVADTGIGIAEEDLAHVFNRFWRADAARASATGGLGIGLAVTKEIVERHRGLIGVERRPEGGTRFTIRIPLA